MSNKAEWRLQVDVSSREEVMRVMEIGARNRAVAETKMNERSSRSHSVLTVIVDGLSHVTGQRTHGCLHLIDLAGAAITAPAVGQQLACSISNLVGAGNIMPGTLPAGPCNAQPADASPASSNQAG